MAEKSIFWTTGATGDGATPYTQAEVIRWVRQWMLGDNTTEGVNKSYENELEVTGAATPVQIDTGAGIVYGFPYWNTSAVNKAIATPAGNTRYDRVVLQAGWAAQTVRIAVLTGVEGAGVPLAVTQTDGVTWEISLATLQVTTGGVITVTDTRVFVHPNIAVDENLIDASVAGDGLAGGDGTPLSVGVDNATIETSGDQLRVKDGGIDADALAGAVAGDGLAGGGGSALSVNVDDATIEINADTLRVKDLGISTAKLAANAADENKIATSVAGDGLTGAGGAPIDVNVDDVTIETSADTLQLKNAGHGPTQHADRTRKFLVTPNGGHNVTTTASPLPTSASTGLPGMNDTQKTIVGGTFYIPSDYVSGMQVTFIAIHSGVAGDVYGDLFVNAGACSESYNTHATNSGYAARASVSGKINCLPVVSMGAMGISAGDFITVTFERDATNVLDTFNAYIYPMGFLIEYTADE